MWITNLIEASSGIDFTGVQPFTFATPKVKEDLFAKSNEDEILATPFPLFSIEMEDDNSVLGGDNNENMRCIVVRELAPDEYIFYVMTQNRGDDSYVANLHTFHKGEDAYPYILDCVRIFLEKMKNSSLGFYNESGKAKYRNAKGKKCVFKPRNTIYVDHKKSTRITKTEKTKSGKFIRHIFGWSVMSHWRKLKNPTSLGLDRNGDRNVVGYTWICTYEKGDEKAKTMVRKVS